MKAEVLKKYGIAEDAEVRVMHYSDFLKTDSRPKITKNDSGFLCGMAPVAKVGIMTYKMSDGSTIRQFVPPETLFNPDSMATLKMKPMTDTHPPERKVSVSNASYRQIGMTGETVTKVDDRLEVSLIVTDAEAIAAIEAGRQELSPGYETEVVFKAGQYNGANYDAIQASRKYNHLAIVDEARGGADLRLQMDGMETPSFKMTDSKENLKKENSVKYTIDGIEYDAAPEVVNALTKSLEALKTANDGAQALTGERDALKTKVAELEKRDISKEICDGVAKRRELERTAELVLDAVDVKLSDRALKVEVIKAKLPTMAAKINDSTAEAYVDAVLETVVSGLENDSLSAQRKVLGKQVVVDEKDLDEGAARKRMIENDAKAYLPKTK
jgi:hypothetical protein